jgi:hypothetical protein
MNRPGRCCFVFFVLLGALLAASGADEPKDKEKAAKTWLIDRALTISPQAEPRPALKYRLLPSTMELKPGNAVPIYLRLVHEQNDASRRLWVEQPLKWNNLPLDRLPLEEARKFLAKRSYMLRQLELGARRQKAEWDYTLDAGNPIGLLLPDVQTIRGYFPLLLLQSRVALAEKDYPAAVLALETGFAVGQHIGEGPFLVSCLVGIAVSTVCADAVQDVIGQPGAPNLYWALTALPRPLVSLRKAEDFERNILPLQFPDLADVESARTAEQWEAVLGRLRVAIRTVMAIDRGRKDAREARVGKAGDPASKSADLEKARKYLVEQRKLTAERVKAMPDAQVLVLWIHGVSEELTDDYFKTTYLPFLQFQPYFAKVSKRVQDAPADEGHALVKALLPALGKVRMAQMRLDRRIAALRVIEALRLHAAANGGKLPDKLADVTVVPVPDDPGTGKPFDYQADGNTATLSGTLPGEPLELNGLRYRLTMR